MPGSSCSGSGTVDACRSAMRSRSSAATLMPSVDAAPLRVAVTTTCSRTGTCATVGPAPLGGPTSARAAASVRTGWSTVTV
jgi:hypothetical protein